MSEAPHPSSCSISASEPEWVLLLLCFFLSYLNVLYVLGCGEVLYTRGSAQTVPGSVLRNADVVLGIEADCLQGRSLTRHRLCLALLGVRCRRRISASSPSGSWRVPPCVPGSPGVAQRSAHWDCVAGVRILLVYFSFTCFSRGDS